MVSLLFSPGMRSTPPASAQIAGEATEVSGSGGMHYRKPADKKPAKTGKKRQDVEDDAQKLYLQNLEGMVADECREGDPVPKDAAENAGFKACHLNSNNFILALAPDPAHTHLALYFDRGVEAIQEALQDENYLFVRAVMPWDPRSHPESDDHEERQETEWTADATQSEPGLMVFRKSSSGQSTPLLVFVVGESPTGGIRKEQFQNTIAEMEYLIRGTPSKTADHSVWKLSKDRPGLRILGPSFSGSLASLSDLLQCHTGGREIPCFDDVSIYSGSVSSRQAIDHFARHEQLLHAHMVSFQESDEVMIERFVEFVAGNKYGSRGYNESRIVLLSEDETAYGDSAYRLNTSSPEETARPPVRPLEGEKQWEPYSNVFTWFGGEGSNSANEDGVAAIPDSPLGNCRRSRRGSNSAQQNADGTPTNKQPYFTQFIRKWTGDEKGLAYTTNRGEDQACRLTLYFPREISQLRASYEKDVAATASEGRSTPRDILPSYSDVPGSDDDTVPAYSMRQMPLSQEGVLQGLVSELRKDNAQFVIVRASDPNDTLFLIHYLRTAYPQGRVVTLGADMLFRREAEDPHFHGIIALSTYSLAPAANHGFRDYEQYHAERIFPSNMEAGTYNAVRALTEARQLGIRQPAVCDEDCRSKLQTSSTQQSDLFWQAWHEQSPVSDFWSQLKGVPLDEGRSLNGRYVLQSLGSEKLNLYQYGWRQQQQGGRFKDYDAPPVRVLALGRDQYWPIAILGPYETEPNGTMLPEVTGQLIAMPEAIEIPNDWRAVQLVALALAWLYCWRLYYASIFASFQGTAKFAPAACDYRMPLILLNGGILIVILCVLMWPALHGAINRRFGLEPLLGLTVFVVFALTLVDAKGRMSDKHPFRKLGKMQYVWWWLEIAIFIVFFGFLFYAMGKSEDLVETKVLTRWYSTMRAVQLTSGLSFIMPTFFFLTVWLWWAEHVSSGYALRDDRHPRLPREMSEKSVETLKPGHLLEVATSVQPELHSYFLYIGVALVVGGAGFFLFDWPHPIMSLERNFLETVMTVLFLLALIGIIGGTLRTLQVWIGLRTLLNRLDSFPLRDGFKSIDGFCWKPIWRLGAGSLDEFVKIFGRTQEAMHTAIRTLPELKHDFLRRESQDTEDHYSGVVFELDEQLAAVRKLADDIKYRFPHRFLLHWFENRRRELEVIYEFGKYQKMSSRLAGKALDRLARHWSTKQEEAKRTSLDTLVPFLPLADNTLRSQRTHDEQNELEARACERFVCMSYVSFVLVMLVRIRTLIVAVGGMYVLTLIGISQYPFEPKGALQLLLVVLLAFVVSVVGLVFAQMHRDNILSNLTDTKPGELGVDFYIRMASFVALPLFSLLASQFPSVNRFFYSWLQPAVEALNR